MIVLPLLLSLTLGIFAPALPESGVTEYAYPNGIDALSAELSSKETVAAVRFETADGWSPWETLTVDDEQDPDLLESNLVMFPKGVTRIAIRADGAVTPHPITVSDDAVHYQVASLVALSTPRILTRRDWGADESLLLSTATNSSSSSSSAGQNHVSSDETPRESDCQQAVTNYPEEFRASTPVTTNADGDRLRWPVQYSPSIKLLVVHHTAGAVHSETRTGPERMRAIYQYHALNRGWGDVGYHYIIDEDGKIYEGRQGGDYVVGGHAYCNNIGSIGIALMGNFDEEQPSQVQTQSLQWLMKTLADKYRIDLNRNVMFHGKELPPIVGHRQLVPTDCPGTTLWGALDLIRKNVRSGDTAATVRYPTLAGSSSSRNRRSSSSASATHAAAPARKSGLSPLGPTTIEARPGGDVLISLLYAPDGPKRRGATIARIKRSNPRLRVEQEQNGVYEPIRAAVILQQSLADEDAYPIRLKVKIPTDTSTSYTLYVEDIAYTLSVSGRRIRTPITEPTRQTYTPSGVPQPRATTVTRPTVTTRRSSSSRASSVLHAAASGSPTIRIRLTDTGLLQGSAVIEAAGSLRLNETVVSGPVTLNRDGSNCRVSALGKVIDSGPIERLDASDGVLKVNTFKAGRQRYRGVLECRVIDGQLVLINELPLEEYMRGLAEEPDTEPYEKQRAFAVAARTYAAYYLNPAYRKFPGKPYDGSDSPAEFQLYGGVDFEGRNPRWLQAVQSTKNLVLTVDGRVLRTPYFSANDGRTRSPEEAGWKNFPDAEVFAAKDDPWCKGETLRGHGVGMSGCGAKGQANEGKTGEEILRYYYTGAAVSEL